MASIMLESMLLIFLSLRICFSQTQPLVIVTPRHERRSIGKFVEINCTILNGHDFPVFWYKVDLDTGNRQLVTDVVGIKNNSRHYLLHESNVTHILRIENIQVNDTGVYKCTVVTSPTTNYSDTFELRVFFPATIIEPFAKIVTTREGEHIHLECHATGYPSPLVSWRRQHNVALATGRTIHRKNILEISSVSKEDRGIYFCTAENGVGENRSRRKSMVLRVHFAPALAVNQPKVDLALKGDAFFTCRIEAHPHPNIMWQRNGETLRGSNRSFSIITKTYLSTRHDYTNTTLQVKSIELWQYGVYVCYAENRMGTAHLEIQLIQVDGGAQDLSK